MTLNYPNLTLNFLVSNGIFGITQNVTESLSYFSSFYSCVNEQIMVSFDT